MKDTFFVEGPRRNFAGGAGLLSTAHDYARFLQMIANGGQLDGVRILSPKTVALMTTNQVGLLFDGAYGSAYSVDPKEHLVMVFMMNQLPNRVDINQKWITLVYQALVEPRT